MYENNPSDRRCSPRMANHPVVPKRRNHDPPLPSREFFSSLLGAFSGKVETGFPSENAINAKS